MSPDIQRIFDKLQRQKTTLLSELETWPQSRLKFHPHVTSWCAIEIIDHLCKVEKSIIVAIRKSSQAENIVTLRDSFGALVVRLVMLSPRRVTVPSATPGVLPNSATNLAAVCKCWNETRIAMAELLDSLAYHARVGVVRHPRSGWMNLAQALKFLSVHLLHHRYQLKRIEHAALSSEARA